MSEPIHEDDSASPERVARLGEELRAARIAHSMDTSDVAQRLNLELYVVEGLEHGDYERLPEPAYIRGYLLSYLRLMDLPLSMLESFDEQYPMDGPLATSPGISSQSACSRDGWVRCISTGLVVLLILAVGLWVLEESFNLLDPGVEPVAVEQPDEILSQPEPDAGITSFSLEEDESMGINEQVLEPGVTDSAETSDLPAGTASLDVATVADSTEETVTATSEAGQETVAIEPGQETVAEPEQETVAETSASTLPRLDMKFLGTSWVRIDDSAGSKLKAGTFNEGENISVEHEGEMRLIIGRSQNVELNYAGEPVDLSEFKSGVARLKLGKSSD